MSQFWVSGPARLWVGTGSSKAFAYLGYSESGVTVEGNISQEDIPADYAGNMPADIAVLGLDVRISAILSRYNEATYSAAVSPIPFGSLGPGQFGTNELGTLMIAEGKYYPLLVYSPYVVKSAFSSMIPGWNFMSVRLADSFPVTLSVRNKRPAMNWQAIPQFGIVASGAVTPNSAPYNASSIYTNVMPDPLPASD